VTTSADGFMRATDKVKLDGVATGAAALTSTAPTQVSVTAAAPGVATDAARRDHVHNVATAAPIGLTVGGPNAAGISAALARADHVHAMQAFGSTPGTICEGNDARLLALVNPATNGFRLAPTADDSIPADGTFATIYLAPVESDVIALYAGTPAAWVLLQASGVSYTLSGRTAGRPFDVFAWWTGAAVQLEMVDWAAATTRAAALIRFNGVWSKESDTTRRYLGTVRPRSATTYRVQRANRIDVGSVGIDYWNISNRRQTGLTLLGGGNYGYTSTAFRQAGALATAQVDAIAGVAGDPVALSLLTGASTTHTSDVLASVAIGQNNTTPIGPRNSVSLRPGVVAQELAAFAAPTGPLGVTAYLWLEAGGTAVTFFGDNGAATTTGLTASVWY
jgi:hypothetical protein